MAIEIPNFLEAAGLFDGNASPAGGKAIISAEGFQAFNPATSPSVPLGGFTREAAGTYILQLTQPIDGAEGGVFLTKFFVAPIPNAAIPAGNIFQDGKIGVADSNPDSETPVDFTFYCAIIRWTYGPNSTGPS